MSYELQLAKSAIEKLGTVPRDLLDSVERALNKLAEDPKRLGRESPTPPYVPFNHIFQFHERHNEELHYFTVFFLYGDEGESLMVWDIVISPRFTDQS